jgi:hypothetical protein
MATDPADIRIDPDRQRKIEKLAGSNGRSASDIAHDAIDAFYAAHAPACTGMSGLGFYDNPTLDQLAQAQGTQPVPDIHALRADFWPADETADDFLDARRSWREDG